MLRRLRLLTIPVAIASLIGIGVTTARTGAPPEVRYVALGDSYSSGLGAGGVSSGGDCDRSSNAYPALWTATHNPESFQFAACSGARTEDVLTKQLTAVNAETTLVSITVGGNDVGYVDVMVACTLEGPLRCASEVDSAEERVRTELPADLDRLYSAIAARAPRAKVVVLSYPRFYDVAAAPCPGVLDSSRSRINAGADLLDETIAAVARRHGFTVADVRPVFADGHEICDHDSWLNSVELFAISHSYHPNGAGQANGYLPVFAAAAA
jgi:lysophospholipase L1-like esterase